MTHAKRSVKRAVVTVRVYNACVFFHGRSHPRSGMFWLLPLPSLRSGSLLWVVLRFSREDPEALAPCPRLRCLLIVINCCPSRGGPSSTLHPRPQNCRCALAL